FLPLLMQNLQFILQDLDAMAHCFFFSKGKVEKLLVYPHVLFQIHSLVKDIRDQLMVTMVGVLHSFN
ncbi:hypothetical protein A2U01_0090871, partial [Trifolium medium]|nr:hypothetical protein [Trifolium medium]